MANPTKKCDLAVIRCSDYRYSNGVYTLARAVAERFGQSAQFDVLAKPGASFCLANGPDHHRTALLDDLHDLIERHHFEQVWLVPHSTCGKYAMHMQFASVEEEEDRLYLDMVKAAPVILHAFPNLRVLGSIAEMTPTTLLRVVDVYDSTQAAPARAS